MLRSMVYAAPMSLLAVLVWTGVAAAQQEGNPALGKKTYETFCIVCHGPKGEGSPLGKPLNALEAKLKSDSELMDIITKGGGPGSAMSAYGSGLSRDEIFWTMLYIRELQGQSRIRGNEMDEADLPDRPVMSEDAQKGEALFNGEAGCIKCHSYLTRGGLVGPDLSNIASKMTPEDIRTAVLQPNANIDPLYGTKQIVLNDGTRVEGRFRDETIKYIQVANEDCTLWRTYFKKNISKMRDGRTSLMPADYATKLSEEQQNQLFAFLDTLK